MPEGVPPRDELIRQQISQVWTMLLGQMTQEGATREEIAQVTLSTVGAILGTTLGAMWPEGAPTVAQEQAMRTHLESALQVATAVVA